MTELEHEKNLYSPTSRWSLFFFCGYVVTWYLQVGSRISFLGALRFEFCYAIALLLLAFLQERKTSISCALTTTIVAYFLVLILQLCISRDFDNSLNVFMDRVIKFSVFGFLIVCFVRSPNGLKWFLAAFLLSCLKMGLEGVLGKVSGNMMWQDQGIMRLHGATSLYGHPNSFSGMALGTIPFIFKLWRFAGRYGKILLAVLFFLSLNIIIYTASRTGYIGFVCLVVIMSFTGRDRKLPFLCLVAMMLVLGANTDSDYFGRFSSIFTQTDKEGGSTIARKQIVKDAVEVFVRNPVGVGIAAFPKVRSEMFGRSQDTHNLYLEIATNLGVQGLIIFGCLIVTLRRTLSYVRVVAGKVKEKVADSAGGEHGYDSGLVTRDMDFVVAVADAVWLFVVARLLVGFFGMDLYEIYWWFATGIAIALLNMVVSCQEKVASHG